MATATIFNIARYSIHDGPGIRTTVFFKGCPLSCKWCHNPESQSPAPQRIFNAEKCIRCGLCGEAARGAAGSDAHCPSGARETIGYEISADALMREIAQDALFYEQSGGGVTFSGGEPLQQAGFVLEMLERCAQECISTAIDTSGCCDTGSLCAVAETADYFLYDIKFMNSEKHEQYCGAANSLILKNLTLLAGTKTKLYIRIPVIPSINDDMREMAEIYKFIRDFTNIAAIHLLPYHTMQSAKYKKIGKEFALADIPGTESPNMREIQALFETTFPVKVGG